MHFGGVDTEYDRANVPPYNGNDPPPAPGSLKRSLFPTLLNEVQNKGTQGVRARYGAELPPIISIVRYPGRPVISVPEGGLRSSRNQGQRNRGQNSLRNWQAIFRQFARPRRRIHPKSALQNLGIHKNPHKIPKYQKKTPRLRELF